ncbi:MAG: cobalamin B12-binding protein [Proteobacteria bacterium]|nr:cobalamin B12-binding protein [Pseudomonadota bacterium]
MRVRVYIADLGHNLLTLSSDVYPLGAANMTTYLRAYLERNVQLDIRLFREPQDLKKALDSELPDVMGFSNYTWNEELAYHFVKYVKARNPSVMTVMGGPNWPLTNPVQEQFLREKPLLDVYVDGPTYEGERALTNLMRRYVDAGRNVQETLSEPIAGNTWIHPRTQQFVKALPVERIRDLDEIPSPYLAGTMDPFLSTGYFPMMQISRGCPFTCAFCNSGVAGNNKIFAHSIENVKADLLYVAERVKPEVNLCFADDNFGMYERDEEIADYIAFLQDKYNWPRYIRTTTGKNKGERIIRVMRKVRGALPMTAAVQSMNPQVLINIKRQNIKLETYRELQEELRDQGMQSYGELILSLPGETKETFLDAIKKFLDNGAQRVSAHQLMLLHGSELSNPDSREKFGLRTKWRMVARNIGNYTGESVAEVEEMVVDTPQFPFADYLEVRVFHLLLTIFYYEGNFDEPFRFAKGAGISAFDLVRAMQARLETAPPDFKMVIDEFLRESREELFDTRDEVIEFARTHYDALVSGELGGNLLSKYSMIGRFMKTRSCIAFLKTVIRELAQERGSKLDLDELDAVMGFLDAVMLQVPFREEMEEPRYWTSHYDVAAWAEQGDPLPLGAFRHERPIEFVGRVRDDRRKVILNKVETFGEHASGLGKFTRTMFARDLRRTLVAVGREQSAQAAVSNASGGARPD